MSYLCEFFFVGRLSLIYNLFEVKSIWEEAVQSCADLDLILVTIHTMRKQEELMRYLATECKYVKV